jgi:WhiB family transcriptional regulator, redox-sensing transcriptional regulator
VPCRTADAEAWWPGKRDMNSPATQGAVAACLRCPVEAACLAYALAADERFGAWRGMLPDERSPTARRRVACLLIVETYRTRIRTAEYGVVLVAVHGDAEGGYTATARADTELPVRQAPGMKLRLAPGR